MMKKNKIKAFKKKRKKTKVCMIIVYIYNSKSAFDSRGVYTEGVKTYEFEYRRV